MISVASSPAATEARLDASERQIDFVMDGHDVVEVHSQGSACRANRVARVVHIGLRLGQFYRLIVNNSASYQRPALFTLYLRLKLRREQINEHKPEIVPRFCVFRARIPQAHYQPIGHVSD